jgi:hypothetical protein
MKSKLAILALVLVCLWGRAASADTITTGDLSFTCQGGCVAPTPITSSTFASSAPTSGSFTYDNTTNQFLNFTLTWNGITWGANGLTEDNYLALIGVGPSQQRWFGFCIAGLVNRWPQFSCDDGIGFEMWLHNGNTVSDRLSNVNPPGRIFFVSETDPTTYPYDQAEGTMTATDLVTTTPEPTTVGLLLLGIGALGLRVRQGARIA